MKIKRIDDTCTNCMLCVQDCAAVVWQISDGVPVAADPESCNLCSHCLAVCPAGAIAHEGLDLLQIEKIDKKRISPESYETITRGRRSIRRFKDKGVPKNILEKIIRVSNYTPTATNSQNVSYIVITDKNVLKKISAKVFGFSVKIFDFAKKFPGNILYRFIQYFSWSDVITRYIDPMQYYIDETKKGRDFILHNAPALILVHGPKGKNFSSENCNLAAGNIINFAYSLGLGTCYIGFLNISLKYSKKLRMLAKIPKNRMAYACIIVGYPAYSHTHTVSRKKPDIEWQG